MRRGASFETDAPRVPEPVAAVESDDDESTIPPPLDPSRERRLPIRTILMALFLFTTGSLLLYFGVEEFRAHGTEKALPMLIVGSICFIPGSYATWILYGAFRGWHGYQYDQVPSYDD